MQGINVNDCYSQCFFCYLRNPPQFSQTTDRKNIAGMERFSPQHARSYGGGIRGSFLKSQTAKRLVSFDISLL